MLVVPFLRLRQILYLSSYRKKEISSWFKQHISPLVLKHTIELGCNLLHNPGELCHDCTALDTRPAFDHRSEE